MIQLRFENDLPLVRAANYVLRFNADRPIATLVNANDDKQADLFYLSSVQPVGGFDDALGFGRWQATRTDNNITLTLDVQCTFWETKQIRFVCRPDQIEYHVTVTGHGTLMSYQPFGGTYSGNVRWGSGFFYSGQSFTQGFNPEPDTSERIYFNSAENCTIDLTGVPIAGRGDWFFTPPPFCFAFESAKQWIGFGVAPIPNHNRFTAFHYHGRHEAFHLSLDYDGQTLVDGRYALPAIMLTFADDPYSAIKKHCDGLRLSGRAPTIPIQQHPDWWQTPIFCGWGSQCGIAAQQGGHAPDYARQENYEQFLATLATHDLDPGIVVLDDKWQATYGENAVDEAKWPDIRRFVAQQHDAGRKVLLWLKAWDPEGLPADECIRNAAGLPIAFDPTNPVFERRLRASVRRMLCDYEADGFKLDFTARIPAGPALQQHGDAWGLELMKHYLSILHDAAKQAKPDALLMTHTPHSYLADALDMIRLNDINTGKDINRAMQHRARIARIACPNAIIDTDNWPITDREAWRDYMPLQLELGIPSLYYVSHIDSTGERLESADYALIRDIWATYRARQA